ncbi:DUF5518 domain-containing protein [Halobaculum sp. MBLA0147]|uniref:DUF5518 domain-containing protein n=1 Tax=Halobaculum sp. MBLA0147 TaxID=3079934 RepID=UPI0035250A8D
MLPSTARQVWSSATWRYALTAGLASVPLTLALSWRTPSESWNLAGVAFAALVAGYFAKRRGLESTAVGTRTGVIGGLPVLSSVPDLFTYVLGLPQPAWFTAVAGVTLVVFVPLLFGFAALVGALAGRLGGWLATQRGHPRRQIEVGS